MASLAPPRILLALAMSMWFPQGQWVFQSHVWIILKQPASVRLERSDRARVI